MTTSAQQETEKPNQEQQNASAKDRVLVILERHKLFGVFVRRSGQKIMRSEQWTVFLCIVMLSIFVTGLFYNKDETEETTETEEEEEKENSLEDSMSDFSIQDFWIIVYSVCITLPVPFILRWFFRRKDIDKSKSLLKQLRDQKIKRICGYLIVFAVVTWCSWSIIAFSLDFGFNTTQKWMISFSIAEISDISIKDPIVALLIILIREFIILIRIRDKSSKVEAVEMDASLSELNQPPDDISGSFKSRQETPQTEHPNAAPIQVFNEHKKEEKKKFEYNFKQD